MTQITTQYIQAGVTIGLGLIGIFLPKRFNPFQFKKYGLGGLLREKIPESIQEKIPKVIGALCIFAGTVVAVLTVILGEMPWE